MKLYQVHSSEDPAGSDFFAPTLGEAQRHVRGLYNGKHGEMRLNDNGQWQGLSHDGFTVYIDRLELKPTAEAICAALNDWPHR